MKRWGHCLTLHLSPSGFRVHGSQLRVVYPGTLSRLTARGNDRQTIFYDETDRTDFLTRLSRRVGSSAGVVQSQAMTPSVLHPCSMLFNTTEILRNLSVA